MNGSVPSKLVYSTYKKCQNIGELTKVVFVRGKKANEIRCSQKQYIGFYTSENIHILKCILSE